MADDGELLALIVGTFSSVSLDPPLVSFMPMRTSKSFERLRSASSLCINVLAGEQEHVARTIATRHENKFDGVEWTPSPSGDPVLAGSVAWLDTRLDQVIEAGDHYIVLCRVEAMDTPNPVAPLIFFQGGYGTFVIPSLVARMEADLVPAIRQAEAARPILEDLAAAASCEVALLYRTDDELVAVASAVGAGAQGTGGLGQRIPVVPPIADIFVALEGPEAEELWLARAIGCDEAQLAVYRERLAFARDHGYLMSFLPSQGADAYADVTEAMRRYAAGTITPAQERALRATLAQSPVIYGPEEIVPGRTYDLGSLVVAVRDERGMPVHCIRLAQLPQSRPGSEGLGRVAALTDAAHAIKEQLRQVGP